MIVSRNEQKMKDKIKEIKKGCPNKNLKFKAVVADFAKMTSIQQYRELLEENIKGLDVGVVIANAGWGE